MNELVEKILGLMDDFKKNANDYVAKGNKSAARRARKNTSELTKLMKDFRRDSIEESKKEEMSEDEK